MGTVVDGFSAQYKAIMADSVGTGSIYETAISELNTLFDDLAIQADQRAQIIASVVSQMSVSISTAAMSAAIQVLTADKQNELVDRQIAGFDDKVRQEITKSLGNVLSLASAASGSIDSGLLATHKESMNKSYEAIYGDASENL